MEDFHYLGNLSGYERIAHGLELQSGEARVQILCLNDRILRVRVAPDGHFLPRRNWAPDRPVDEYPETSFKISEDPTTIFLQTDLVTVRVQRNPLRISFVDRNGHVFASEEQSQGPGWRTTSQPLYPNKRDDWSITHLCQKDLPTNEHYYGFGERTGFLDKRGYRYTNWTTDSWATAQAPITDEMYQAIPFFMAIRPGELAYGLYFNNTFYTRLDMGYSERDHYNLQAIGGEIDYYVVYGPTPAEVLEGYTTITGRTPLPPRWSLGYQQCRWSYDSEEIVRKLAETFRAKQIPCDVIYLDIDYMDGYRVFTWNEEKFPDPQRLLADLKAEGFRVVTIIDPGVKYEPGRPSYEEALAHNVFIRNTQGELAHGYVWPGNCVFPDFARAETRSWWANQHKALIDAGVAGIWNDMNEPATWDDKNLPSYGGSGELPYDAPVGDDAHPATFAEVHNLYGYLEGQATYDGLLQARPGERPFVLTRAGFAGIQHFNAVWTGDNMSAWEHLELALPQMCNLGLSGVSFCGGDIGGFIGHATPELYTRWFQLGALSPFARGHSIRDSLPHEPWVFGPEVEQIVRRYLELRYRFLPYLYTLFHESSLTGAPILRPLVYEYPDDPAVTALHDQALLGKDVLLAPVYRPGVTHRHVYLPAGTWYDYWTGEVYSGPTHLLAAAPLDTLPLYVRAGSILPSGPVTQHTEERPLDSLTLDVYPSSSTIASGRLYEDDGLTFEYQQGQYRLTTYTCTQTAGERVTLQAQVQGDFKPVQCSVTIRVHGLSIAHASVGGEALAVSQEQQNRTPVSIITIPKDVDNWTLALEVGSGS